MGHIDSFENIDLIAFAAALGYTQPEQRTPKTQYVARNADGHLLCVRSDGELSIET